VLRGLVIKNAILPVDLFNHARARRARGADGGDPTAAHRYRRGCRQRAPMAYAVIGA
jgi:hypothetical protein